MLAEPSRQFSTANVTAARRVDAWREVISDVFFSIDIGVDRSSRDRWSASIAEVGVQDLSLTEYTTDCASGTRCRTSVAHDETESYVFCVPLQGEMHFNQHGRAGSIGPDQYVMLRSGDFYQLSCRSSFLGYFLKAPVHSLDKVYTGAERHCAMMHRPNASLCKVLRSTLAAIGQLSAEERETAGQILQRQVLGMLALMLQSEEAAAGESTSARMAVFRRLKALIAIRYPDEAFSPTVAARELGVSPGYMHRCAAAHGTTFREMLKDTRLARSYDMLCQTGDTRMVGEVAFANGYPDHSSFSKAFRSRFGVSPNALRSRPKVTG